MSTTTASPAREELCELEQQVRANLRLILAVRRLSRASIAARANMPHPTFNSYLNSGSAGRALRVETVQRLVEAIGGGLTASILFDREATARWAAGIDATPAAR